LVKSFLLKPHFLLLKLLYLH